jgi:hypothetical protein
MPALEALPPWMMPLLAVLAILVVALVVLQGFLPALRRPTGGRQARARVSAAVARGTDTQRPITERASAFVEAGREANDALRKPRLAARYAHYAHELAPGDPTVVAFTIEAMRLAKRHVGLERALWLSLDRAADDTTFETARAALVALYDGPLKRPERARVLAKLERAATATE